MQFCHILVNVFVQTYLVKICINSHFRSTELCSCPNPIGHKHFQNISWIMSQTECIVLSATFLVFTISLWFDLLKYTFYHRILCSTVSV